MSRALRLARVAARHLPGASLALAVLSVAVFAVADAGRILDLDRGALARGEVWRLLTGHLTHWSFDHLAWDVLAFAVLGAACEIVDRRRFLLCLAVASVTISLGLVWLLPGIETYRGLSGVDASLLVLLTVSLARPGADGAPWIRIAGFGALGAFVAKVAFEVVTGRAVFVAAAGDVVTVPLAHVLGAAVGLALGLSGARGRDPALMMPVRPRRA